MVPEASVVVDGVETSVVLDEDVTGAVLIVLLEVLPCAVLVVSEDVVSDVVVVPV